VEDGEGGKAEDEEEKDGDYEENENDWGGGTWEWRAAMVDELPPSSCPKVSTTE
jgi:hypothetical protein